LDAQKRPIRAITSNPGHCLATGIADEAYVTRTADRLMADDLFSGWGVRTLSSENPAFNPYSYHRSSKPRACSKAIGCRSSSAGIPGTAVTRSPRTTPTRTRRRRGPHRP
jgi:hypothetical protein